MTEFLVAADDRTGALETAGACADAGLSAVVVPSSFPDARCVVVDLASRHVDAQRAATVATSIDAQAAEFFAHKIDSTLRGNWAHELVARQRARASRVLVVPAFPAVGRTCAKGVVLEDGRPVSEGPAGLDALTPVRSSRPADHLRAAGAAAVEEIADAEALRAWLDGEGPAFAVADAVTDADLERVAALWLAHRDVLLAGTAATIGAAAAAISGVDAGPCHARPQIETPALVVCGSLHDAARAQLAALVATGALAVPGADDADAAVAALRVGRHVIVASPIPIDDSVSPTDAVTTAHELAAFVARVVAAIRVPTLVLIGGDTAAAVLGEDPLVVDGTVAPGVAWCRPSGEGGPLVLAKPGGFGGPSALIDILTARMSR